MAESSSSPYEGLHVRAEENFPLTCSRCEQRYIDIDDFVARTQPIFRSSGLLEHEDPVNGTFVLLLRNCTCGTTLALRCSDRRERSQRGHFRRRRFETLHALMVEAGVETSVARTELRRLLHA